MERILRFRTPGTSSSGRIVGRLTGLSRLRRDEKLYADFKAGITVADLQSKYDIDYQQVERIIDQQKKAEKNGR